MGCGFGRGKRFRWRRLGNRWWVVVVVVGLGMGMGMGNQ